METKDKYNFTIDENSPQIAVMALSSQVLGGNDALMFAKKLEEINSKPDIKFLIVDLQKVEVMNSSGLGMLVSGLSSMRTHNRLMVLSGAPEKVMNLLKMTHLDQVFELYPTLDKALDHCS